MIRVRTSVRIDKPRNEVFDVVADPTTYPLWNTAVEDVRPAGGDGSYTMERELPHGPATNLLEVDATPGESVVVRATEGPTPFTYRFLLRDDGGGTALSLEADVEPNGMFRLMAPVAQRAIRHGVDENVACLKRLLENDWLAARR